MTRLRATIPCLVILVLWIPRDAGATRLPQTIYQSEFGEWTERHRYDPAPDYTTHPGLDSEDIDIAAVREFGYSWLGELALGVAVGVDEGNTFWASAQSPIQGGPAGNVIGGDALIEVVQAYTKDEATSSLAFTYSAASLELTDFVSSDCCEGFGPAAAVGYVVNVYRRDESGEWSFDPVWTDEQEALLKIEWHENVEDVWRLELEPEGASPQWRWSCPACGQPVVGVVTATLDGPYRRAIDLSAVEDGEEFLVHFALKAVAFDDSQLETNAKAFARDPVSSDGTILSLETSGLTGIPGATLPDRDGDGVSDAADNCVAVPNGPLASTGRPQRDSNNDGHGNLCDADLNDDGAVNLADLATFRSVFLTGNEDADLDGDGAVNLSDLMRFRSLFLLPPGPSGFLAAKALYGRRDSPFGEPTYRVGGTVTGLQGSGLVVEEVTSATSATPANGVFAFGYAFSDGSAYEVRIRTHPTNPSQICSVANAQGTIAGADASDVLVTCGEPIPNGALDPSFGSEGKLAGSFGGGAVAMALQPDGRLLVLREGALARFLADGTPDAEFGTDGEVDVVFTGSSDSAQALALQGDGRIVVAGYTGSGRLADFALARYEANGSPDTGFGTAGVATTDFGGSTDRAYAVLIQDDGKIVVAGHAAIANQNDYAVARYTSAGAPDPGFGSGGRVTTNVGGVTDLAYAAALQPDGRIVVAGRAGTSGSADPDVGLVRYEPDGDLDPGFGNGGVALRDVGGSGWDEATALAVQEDGRIVVAVAGSGDFAVARFEADGRSLDPAFGTGGLVTTPIGAGTDHARAVAVQADGRIVVAGQASSATVSDFGIARYEADGDLDAGFGSGGLVTVDFFGSTDGAEAVLIQPDGRIVVGGVARNGTSFGLGLARLVP